MSLRSSQLDDCFVTVLENIHAFSPVGARQVAKYDDLIEEAAGELDRVENQLHGATQQLLDLQGNLTHLMQQTQSAEKTKHRVGSPLLYRYIVIKMIYNVIMLYHILSYHIRIVHLSGLCFYYYEKYCQCVSIMAIVIISVVEAAGCMHLGSGSRLYPNIYFTCIWV